MKKTLLASFLTIASTIAFANPCSNSAGVGANPNAVIATLVDGTVIYASVK